MYKKYILLALGVVAVGGVLFFSQLISTSKNPTGVSVVKGGWVEIVSGKAFLINGSGANETKTEIISGAVVSKDNVLETNDKGNAVIHFFDGSVLRMSSSTRLVIKDAEYDKNSGKLTVRANLLFGKVWSKIIELATPDSLWQVETSNTVATVRGTAFGVSSDGKNSEIFGSQHSVSVEFVDPKTQTKLKAKSLLVSEGVSLKVSESDIEELKNIEEETSVVSAIFGTQTATSSAMITPVVEISEEVRSDEWFNENEDEDQKIEDEVVKIKEETHSDRKELKKVLDQKTEDRFFETVKKVEERKKEKEKEKEKENDSASSLEKVENVDSSIDEFVSPGEAINQTSRGQDGEEEKKREELRSTSTSSTESPDTQKNEIHDADQRGTNSSIKIEGDHVNIESSSESTSTNENTSSVIQIAPTQINTEEQHTSLRVEGVEEKESTTSVTLKTENHSDGQR